MEKKVKKQKEYIYAEAYRRSRQSSEESPEPGGRLLSSSRPLMAPKGRIQRTPSREVSDAETDSPNEPEPTPVTVVGDSPPKFKVEIASSGSSGFFIETIESRATTSPVNKKEESEFEKPVLENTPVVKLVPETEIMATVTTTTQAAPAAAPPPAPSPDSSTAVVTSADTTSAPDGLDKLIKAISELPMRKLGPFLCLICLGAFVSSAAELDPTWLVLTTSLTSFVLFYVLKV